MHSVGQLNRHREQLMQALRSITYATSVVQSRMRWGVSVDQGFRRPANLFAEERLDLGPLRFAQVAAFDFLKRVSHQRKTLLLRVVGCKELHEKIPKGDVSDLISPNIIERACE